MQLPTGAELVGRHVRLAPFTAEDVDEMHPLLTDPRVYEQGYVMHRLPVDLEDTRALVRERFWQSAAVPDGRGFGRSTYAVRLVDGGTLVGTSTLAEAHLVNESIHLGSTLYGPLWWGTAVNPECKLLLLTHAFEQCGAGRVKLQTDLLNTRSQAAIVKLGAQREGVIRRDMRREDGTFRDSVVFSVLVDEWPAVRAGLQERVRR